MIVARFHDQLAQFAPYAQLQTRLAWVLCALPESVQCDFMEDTTFRITLEDYTPETGWKLFMACPTSGGMVSRCVVLRSKLNETSVGFTDYVIAHEFAHAFLRNGGWGEITDIELAADALAASWGFSRPNAPC
ncbi:MAG: hypothetical protein R3C09_14000 [Pirellulaceae bacterium]